MEVCDQAVSPHSHSGVPIEYYKIIISVIFNKNFHNLKPHYDRLKNEINFS